VAGRKAAYDALLRRAGAITASRSSQRCPREAIGVVGELGGELVPEDAQALGAERLDDDRCRALGARQVNPMALELGEQEALQVEAPVAVDLGGLRLREETGTTSGDLDDLGERGDPSARET
jgi:hypothetical protein